MKLFSYFGNFDHFRNHNHVSGRGRPTEILATNISGEIRIKQSHLSKYQE